MDVVLARIVLDLGELHGLCVALVRAINTCSGRLAANGGVRETP